MLVRSCFRIWANTSICLKLPGQDEFHVHLVQVGRAHAKHFENQLSQLAHHPHMEELDLSVGEKLGNILTKTSKAKQQLTVQEEKRIGTNIT